MKEIAALVPKTSQTIVVSIDLGTSGTGFAYAHVKDTQGKVYNNVDWDGQLFKYCKTLSAILYEGNTRVAIGHNARETINDQEEDSSNNNYHFIEHFKMNFMKDPNSTIHVNGKGFSVKKVMKDYLEEIKTVALEFIKKSETSLRKEMIRWVFTVPAQYDDRLKHELKLIAKEAGIIEKINSEEQCMIVTEPEAAAVYCIEEMKKDREIKKGDSIIIMDAGGGTVDFTTHIINDQMLLREVTQQTGGSHGSTNLDRKFEELLVNKLGQDLIDDLKSNMSSFYNVKVAWESYKPKIRSLNKTYSILVPQLASFIMSGNYHNIKPGFFRTQNATISMTPADLEFVYNETLEQICGLLDQQISKASAELGTERITYLFIVGGFGQCQILTDKIAREFGDQFESIRTPSFAGEAIMNGAALLGINPSLIKIRKARLTYGVETSPEFDTKIHKRENYIRKDGRHLCSKVFHPFVRAGEEVEIGYEAAQEFYALGETAEICVYSSVCDFMDEDVVYVDDLMVSELAVISIKVPQDARTIRVTMIFGKSEFLVKVENDDQEQEEYTLKFDAKSLDMRQ
ncbi:HSP70 [Acrasis kona]|uniref:HSP70 n=1 Tax=Acrasis kona TaxID=1008807 RepID=A0AAW2YYL5_9EUKA